MLKLNELKSPKGARKNKKIVGRGSGSGHGKTSGRGHKGQLSRTGKGKRPGFEGGQMPLIRRVPKRGFISKFKKEYQLVNLQSLNKCADKATVTPKELKALGLIHKLHVPVKILAHGKLEKSITVKAHKFSKTAIKAIEALGGKAEILSLAAKQDSNA
ncbi:MAG: 50S ribosomal protein L15 [Candidatus Omnitrophica bacterium]|nr:50S ribosomal protein L15 [Candidatus Omnitrophota bacterium]